MNAVDRALERYIAVLEDRQAFASVPVRRAFLKVKRHRFIGTWYRPEVDEGLRATFRLVPYDPARPTTRDLSEIYSDNAIVTAVSGFMPTSSTSQPWLVAYMLEQLDLRPGMRVLEIGAGTGYNAALLAEIVGSTGKVCTVELQDDVAEQARTNLRGEGYADVQVFCRDGFFGVPEAAPFDRIVATVGCAEISPHWLEQLASRGFMLVPLGHGFHDPLVRVEPDPRSAQRATGRLVGHSSFMPIRGTLGSANPWRSYGILRLPERPAWTRPRPEPFAGSDSEATHPLDLPAHRAFHFFLALSSRELWFNGQGYGLADPGSAAVVVMTRDAVQGYSASSHGQSLERLYDRFSFLAETWNRLGSPSLEDYSIEFLPVPLYQDVEERRGMEWLIERPFFWEVVRLPNDAFASTENG